MSADTIGLSILGAIVVLVIVLFAARRRQIRQHQSGEAPYRWQPEQDYDVIQTGESAMTPAWPELKRREKKIPAENHRTEEGNN